MLYRGMDRAALDAGYNNGAAVGAEKADKYRASWRTRSEALRAARKPRMDLRFGDGARERLDFYPGGKSGAPTLMFIHGGYWQMNDKEPFHFVAAGPLTHGLNVAIVEYTLAPEARMEQIVAEIHRATDYLLENLGSLGGDPETLYVSGHSAGGHLTAVAMDNPRVAGGLPISGIFELEPISLCYLNDKLQLDAGEIERHSPIRHIPQHRAAQVVAVGAAELPELVRQSKDYEAAWSAAGNKGRYLPLDGHEHFSILEELADPEGRLTQALLELVAGTV